MRYEKRGLRNACAEGAGSVCRFIGIGSQGIFLTVFVKHRLAHHIFLASPIPKVKRPAALAAKWKIRVSLRVGRLTADRTISFHRRFFSTLSSRTRFRGEGSAFAFAGASVFRSSVPAPAKSKPNYSAPPQAPAPAPPHRAQTQSPAPTNRNPALQ